MRRRTVRAAATLLCAGLALSGSALRPLAGATQAAAEPAAEMQESGAAESAQSEAPAQSETPAQENSGAQESSGSSLASSEKSAAELEEEGAKPSSQESGSSSSQNEAKTEREITGTQEEKVSPAEEPVTAQSADVSSEEALRQAQAALDAALQQQSAAGQDQSDLQKKVSEITGKLRELGRRYDEAAQKLDETKKKLDAQQKSIEQSRQSLAGAQEKLLKKSEEMQVRIRFLYEKGDDSYLEILMSASDFSDFLNKSSFIQELTAYDQRILEDYADARDEVQSRREALDEQKQELQDLEQEQKKKQSELDALLAKTKRELSSYEDQLAQVEKLQDSLSEMVQKRRDALESARLGEYLASESGSSGGTIARDGITVTASDRTLLANLIYCEAGGEPYVGQVAVGNVVLNRVQSSRFPNTISGVIYQAWQFTPAMTGRLALALARGDATASCYRAADAALAGEAPVGGCLFFRTPVSSISPKYRIGGHIFY